MVAEGGGGGSSIRGTKNASAFASAPPDEEVDTCPCKIVKGGNKKLATSWNLVVDRCLLARVDVHTP